VRPAGNHEPSQTPAYLRNAYLALLLALLLVCIVFIRGGHRRLTLRGLGHLDQPPRRVIAVVVGRGRSIGSMIDPELDLRVSLADKVLAVARAVLFIGQAQVTHRWRCQHEQRKQE
jgi:hypothetical protein